MKLIFVRHGKDDERYRGGWSRRDLTEEGIAQAKQLAAYLRAHNEGYRICRILSSDLPRAMTTAGCVSDALGIRIEGEPLLREIDNGDLSGMLNEDALVQYPGLYFNTLDMDEPYPNGESPAGFQTRIQQWFTQICARQDTADGNILIVTHGGVINVICHLVKGIAWNNKNRPFPAAACSIHVLDVKTMTFELENFTDHLRV